MYKTDLFGNEIKTPSPSDILRDAPLAPCKDHILIAFSGGNDSRALAHVVKVWSKETHYTLELASIKTGLQMDGWEKSVKEFADWIDLPVSFWEGEGRTYYSQYVAMYGFPGAAAHGQIQARLKGRAYRKMFMARRTSTESAMAADGLAVWILSGIRKDESQKRQLLKTPYSYREGVMFINPLFYWSNAQTADYLIENNIPLAPGKQWDCKCGATVKVRADEINDIKKNAPRLQSYLQSLNNPMPWGWAQFDSSAHGIEKQLQAGQQWLDDGSMTNYPTCVNCIRDALADDERAMREW